MDGIRRCDLLKAAGVVGGASVLTLGGRPAAATSRRAEETTVFERGETDDFHTFRIPVLVRAADGSMLAFAQGRVDNAEDFGHIQLVLERSADGGRTWGALRVVAADPPHRIANQSVVLDRSTGRLHLFFVRTGGDVTDQDIVDGTVGPEDVPRPFVIHSDDNGVTWSPWRELTDDVKLPQMRHYVGGPTHGIQLAHGTHAGRLLVPGNHNILPATADRPAVVGIHTVYSDDHGETWRLGGALGAYDDGIVVPNETAVVELGDGTVYFNTRDHQGTAPGNRAAATSSDGGQTLDGPFEIVPDLETPIVSGSLVRQNRRTDRGERIVFAAPWHPSSRDRLTLWSSLDAGATWAISQVVHDGPAGYSDLATVDDDTLGVLYENGPRLSDETPLTYHQRISLARVPMATIDRPVPRPGHHARRGRRREPRRRQRQPAPGTRRLRPSAGAGRRLRRAALRPVDRRGGPAVHRRPVVPHRRAPSAAHPAGRLAIFVGTLAAFARVQPLLAPRGTPRHVGGPGGARPPKWSSTYSRRSHHGARRGRSGCLWSWREYLRCGAADAQPASTMTRAHTTYLVDEDGLRVPGSTVRPGEGRSDPRTGSALTGPIESTGSKYLRRHPCQAIPRL
ncbi:sialidase family protein [Jiangella alkaliphila]|uniref:exo-alpha-sialidase n=1 Tax=Jiangella alkaliphila TaxID=419479 RepID=A0A1H2LEU6_9ACTN|nr:sialidase family protein [Jiangella alkaliphila]SDU79362.1 BNR repeat-like domain-containing protein [Jiangella alkaliphila]